MKEMMVARFDGGVHQPQTEETTMLNTTDKVIQHKIALQRADHTQAASRLWSIEKHLSEPAWLAACHRCQG
jgi:hypothetical protein